MVKLRTRVAIVDDDESVRKALKRLFEVAAFDVIGCSSGEQLFESIPSFKPHCIVLDLHMPGLNGFQILRRLTQTLTPSAIIIITGHDSLKARDDSIALGAKAYFAKPIDGDELIAAVRKTAVGITY